jgi:phosphoribosyl-AMP cyclohydrolase
MIPKSVLDRFNNGELVAAIVQDIDSKEVLMLAWVNQEALEKSISTKSATFWSRSRNKLWVKGSESGNTQQIINISLDCDSDALLFQVKAAGPACHTGAITCFDQQIN